MNEATKAYVESSLKDFRDNKKGARLLVAAPGKTMDLVQLGDLTIGATKDQLHYYASWMAYFAFEWTKWQACHEYLESQYKKIYARELSTPAQRGEGKYKERQVEIKLEDLNQAMLFAKSRERSNKHAYLTAETQRDLVSRFITLESNELKTIGRY